jgi:hypothetical protein
MMHKIILDQNLNAGLKILPQERQIAEFNWLCWGVNKLILPLYFCLDVLPHIVHFYGVAGDVVLRSFVILNILLWISIVVALWFAVLGLINFLYLWIYSELKIWSCCGWFVMHSGFHAIEHFHFAAIYGVLSDVNGWSTDELTNLLFCLISILLLYTNQNPCLLCDTTKPYN